MKLIINDNPIFSLNEKELKAYRNVHERLVKYDILFCIGDMARNGIDIELALAADDDFLKIVATKYQNYLDMLRLDTIKEIIQETLSDPEWRSVLY